ncbi:hypothetical protein [Luteimonas sp. MHLX1A]|uniref:hypothetical protein n=1 Tax=Alterluteimonas muca TaxID=2878684 RepID=UPI001E3B622A|nr:hypothetical protein [Luteimonas sp. MHLX1A]MCD9046834.1 hypothetical protein [Luteimonas sp. MHLX1A]
MANLIVNGRSNTFKVKDEAAFREALSELDVVIHSSAEGVSLLTGDEGGWPNHDHEEDEPIDFLGIVSSHLAEGEVAVFVSAGWEKQRYVFGEAQAVNGAGEVIYVGTDSIYDMALKSFGIEPTRAEA